MTIHIEAIHVYRLTQLHGSRGLTEGEWLALSLSSLAIIPDLEDADHLTFLPSWEELDFIISPDLVIEVYNGELLIRRASPIISDKVECFFERCDEWVLSKDERKELMECAIYLISHQPKNLCIPAMEINDFPVNYR